MDDAAPDTYSAPDKGEREESKPTRPLSLNSGSQNMFSMPADSRGNSAIGSMSGLERTQTQEAKETVGTTSEQPVAETV